MAAKKKKGGAVKASKSATRRGDEKAAKGAIKHIASGTKGKAGLRTQEAIARAARLPSRSEGK